MEVTNDLSVTDAKKCGKESVCDRRDMKLKEAEKTIANKDVIIKMLQDQVKKLEDCYKQNLQETETFRYRFYLASEQVTRLRGACPRMKENSEKSNKDIKGEIVKWKNQCDQLIAKECSGNCKYLQQIKNIAKIMKAHYELLQLLSEKLLKKNTTTESDPTRENMKNEYNDQISKLQHEITQLKDENLKLQNQIYERTKEKEEESLETEESGIIVPSVRDSLINAFKRNNQELQQKVSKIMEKTGTVAEEILQEDDEGSLFAENQLKRVSFSREILSGLTKKNGGATKSDVKCRERATIEEEIKVQDENGHSHPSILHMPIETPITTLDKGCDCKSKDAQVQVTETVINRDTTSQRTTNLTATQDKKEDVKKTERNTVKEVTDENVKESIQVTTKVYTEVPEEHFPKKVSLKPDIEDDIYDAFVDENVQECEDVEDPTNTDDDNAITHEMGSNRSSTSGDTNMELQKTSSTEEELKFEDCACFPSSEDAKLGQAEPDDGQKRESEKLEQPDDELDQLFHELDTFEKLKVPIEETKPRINNIDVNEMILKLNNIGDKVVELLEKQDDAHKELASLKTELTDTRDSTQACTENISKLAEIIDEQKETFLGKFQEHKTVTDNLIRAKEEIQQNLGDLKQKIEILLKSIENGKDRKSSGTCLKSSVDVSEDVITIEALMNVLPHPDTTTITAQSIRPLTQSRDGSTQDKAETSSDQTNLQLENENLDENNKDLNKMEETYAYLEEQDKTKDQRMQCVNSMLKYYKKVQDEIATMSSQTVSPRSNSKERRYKCDGIEIQNYIDKVKGENLKVRTTISSVIDNLEGKLSDLKGGQDREGCSSYPSVKTKGFSCDVDLCSCGRSSVDVDSNSFCDNVVVPSDLEIEDIYKAVRRTILPCQQITKSSTSCLCNKMKICSSCDCYRDGQSEVEVYNCILCACSDKIGDVQQNDNQNVNSSCIDQTDTQYYTSRSCEIGRCDFEPTELCDKGSLITNLQTYVGYLHDQLNIITSIEDRIEDLRVALLKMPIENHSKPSEDFMVSNGFVWNAMDDYSFQCKFPR